MRVYVTHTQAPKGGKAPRATQENFVFGHLLQVYHYLTLGFAVMTLDRDRRRYSRTHKSLLRIQTRPELRPPSGNFLRRTPPCSRNFSEKYQQRTHAHKFTRTHEGIRRRTRVHTKQGKAKSDSNLRHGNVHARTGACEVKRQKCTHNSIRR